MAVRLHLLVDNLPVGTRNGGKKRSQQIASLIAQSVLPEMELSVNCNDLPEDYPWCFLVSGKEIGCKKYYAGALVNFRNVHGRRSSIIIYSALSYPWLKKNMSSQYPITFWMARILNIIPEIDRAEECWDQLRLWVTALQRSYSPFWESIILTHSYQFKNRSQVLLREGSKEDYRIRDSDGVGVMPWKHWPDNIQEEAGVWLWRQSRHCKILDSQRILLQGDGAERPDVSI